MSIRMRRTGTEGTVAAIGEQLQLLEYAVRAAALGEGPPGQWMRALACLSLLEDKVRAARRALRPKATAERRALCAHDKGRRTDGCCRLCGLRLPPVTP